MIRLPLGTGGDRPLSVLALGAHSDDIEIGCGGALLHLVETGRAHVTWVVFGAAGERSAEARRSAETWLDGAAGADVVVESFEDSFFPYEGAAIKRRFEQLKAEVSPDVVFTHARDDLHQDHRLLCELTWNTFRNHLVLEYEIPKYDGDLGRPNLFVPLSEEIVARKVGHLLEHFPTQAGKAWFTEDVFRSLMRLRGMESNAPSGFAEGFTARKIVLGQAAGG